MANTNVSTSSETYAAGTKATYQCHFGRKLSTDPNATSFEVSCGTNSEWQMPSPVPKCVFSKSIRRQNYYEAL